MVKIKLVTLEINNVVQVQTMDDTIYFIGHRNREKILFSIHINTFFQSLDSPIVNALPTNNQPPTNAKVLVFHSHQRGSIACDFLYLHPTTKIISLKLQHITCEVAEF